MVAGHFSHVAHDSDTFTYEDACRIAWKAATDTSEFTVLVVLDRVSKTTSAALAKLIALRRELLRSGRDIRLIGLRGQALALYEINRLGSVLPRQIPPRTDRCESHRCDQSSPAESPDAKPVGTSLTGTGVKR